MGRFGKKGLGEILKEKLEIIMIQGSQYIKGRRINCYIGKYLRNNDITEGMVQTGIGWNRSEHAVC